LRSQVEQEDTPGEGFETFRTGVLAFCR